MLPYDIETTGTFTFPTPPDARARWFVYGWNVDSPAGDLMEIGDDSGGDPLSSEIQLYSDRPRIMEADPDRPLFRAARGAALTVKSVGGGQIRGSVWAGIRHSQV